MKADRSHNASPNPITVDTNWNIEVKVFAWLFLIIRATRQNIEIELQLYTWLSLSG